MRRAEATLSALLLAAVPLAASAADFKIGTILPLTGPGADIGRFLAEGAKAAVVMVNKTGGIGGMHVQMIVCDTQSVEQQAVLCARRLASEEKVGVLLGAGTTPQTLAIIPTVENAEVPLFAIAGGVVNYRPLKKWVFKAIATNEDQIPAAVDYLKSKGITKVASILDNGPFGRDVADNLKSITAKAGLEIVDAEVYTQTDTDMSAQVTHVRAQNPQAIFDMSSNPPPGAIVAKKIFQLGVTVPIVAGINLQTKPFVDLSGGAADQLLFMSNEASVATVPDSDPLAPNIRAFRAAFMETDPGQPLVGLTPSCADPILVTQAAAKPLGAKALDGNALRASIETIQNVRGVQGTWSFSPRSHESSMRAGTIMLKYANGDWVPAP